jgi:hypothetical protein
MKKIALISFFAISGSTSAQQINIQALEACTLVDNDFKRLICFDKIMSKQPIDVKNLSKKNIVASSDNAKEISKLTDEAQFGMTKKLLSQKTALKEVDKITSAISKVETSLRGIRTFQLENGQTWQQVGTDSFRAKSSDKVDIIRASLGSFLMKKTGTNRSIRVKRVN